MGDSESGEEFEPVTSEHLCAGNEAEITGAPEEHSRSRPSG